MVSEPTLPREIAAIAARERRMFGVSAVISIALILAAVGFLAYAASTLSEMQRELQETESELHVSRAELAQTEATVAELRSEASAAEAARDGAQADARRLREEAGRAQAEVRQLQEQLDEANRQLGALSEQIKLSADYAQKLHPVDLEDAKILASQSDRLGELLSRILDYRQRDLPFSIANDPARGFTSPAFASHVLSEIGMPHELERLPQVAEPRLGDIVLYRGGFALFYMEDHEQKPFVIGMTPVGIAALEPDFGVPRTGVLSNGILDRP